ncbi:thiaminase II [Pontibacter qinzhouensis]|uniref:Aminopyrimidine aminohydrolase n=1 Tax=Pontibacter qinzhouensis TaxID=2603253 RepID=A0A5C8K7A3_9BACT|nr:thiaminase II [Pontibacter qinzhouensis]TXK48049.1 thiaminase II [Pontibacter qinzhouensis]
MSWSNTAWQAGNNTYQQITKMPFIQELVAGTLPQNKFAFYLGQDSLYLTQFGKALSLIAGRSLHAEQVLAFAQFAEGAIVVERALHASYFRKYNLSDTPAISPVCQHYTNYLLSQAALAQVEVAMAAVLPCFWIYKAVGDYIYQQPQVANNPYQEWINTYAGEEFGAIVQRAIMLCDEVAATCTPNQQQAMTTAFVTATKLEWMFWDSAYRLEAWPV